MPVGGGCAHAPQGDSEWAVVPRRRLAHANRRDPGLLQPLLKANTRGCYALGPRLPARLLGRPAPTNPHVPSLRGGSLAEMTTDIVREFVIREFLPGQDPEALALDQPLISSGLIDSVGTLRLTLFLEETFQIEVSAEDISSGRLDSLAAIADLVASKRPALAGS